MLTPAHHHHRLLTCMLALVTAALLLAPLPAQSPGPVLSAPPPALNTRMQNVLKKFVEETGHSVMGVGSWISGAKFNAATSDFDMRLIVPAGTGPDQQLLQWRNARAQLTKLIDAEFAGEARGILARTNLYAPNQLMAGVEDAEEAMARYVRMNTVPSLSHSGLVTEKNVAKYAEGLYGAGASTYVQGYERQAGRLFYNNNGHATTGLSELAGIGGETKDFYSAVGTANTAGQWAEHCVAELQAGRGDKVAKYLERLERDLVKSRSMNGVPVNDAFRAQIADLKALLKRSPGRLPEVAGDVSRVLARSRAEAAILGSMANAGSLRRGYLTVMLDGVAAGNRLGTLIDRVLAKVPASVDAANAMRLLIVGVGLRAVSESAGRGDDVFQTAANVLGATNLLTLYPPALLAELLAEVINQARANGYDMAAGSQEAWDLMSGIYSSWGRAGVDPDSRRKLTLADLVARFQYERQVEALVMSQAIRASTRNLGAANEQADDGVAQAIFAKCWPVIRNAWRWERDALAGEFLNLASLSVHTPLVIYYKPTQPRPGERIVAEAVSADRKLGDRLERMKEIIRILYGPGSGVAVNYYWDPAGQSGSGRDYERSFTFPAPGVQTVKVRLAIAPFTGHTETDARVMQRREVPALADIDVGATAAVASPATPATTARLARAYRFAYVEFRTHVYAISPPGGPETVGVENRTGAFGFVNCAGNMSGLTLTCTALKQAQGETARLKGTFTLNPAGDTITSFTFESEQQDFQNTIWKASVSGINVPKKKWQMGDPDNFDQFELEGQAVCKHVTTYSWEEIDKRQSGKLVSWGCSQKTSLHIWLSEVAW